MGSEEIFEEENLIIKRFDNPSAISFRAKEDRVRQVVTCVHVPPLAYRHEKVLPIGLQIPVNAYKKGGTNFSSLQGEVESDESTFVALKREASEEYGLKGADIFGMKYLLSTRIPVSPNYPKAEHWDYQWLHWFFLRTVRSIRPNPESVEKFDWFAGPTAVFDAMATAREEKLCALAVAINAAVDQEDLPAEYAEFADLSKYRPKDSEAA